MTRIEIVISDNIQPRCGCPIRGKGRGRWVSYPVKKRIGSRRIGSRLIGEWRVILECLTCRAAWEWGEICAQPDPQASSPPKPCAS